MKIVLVCAGLHAKVVAETLVASGGAEVVGVLDDNPALQGTTVHGLSVLGTLDRLDALLGEGIADGAVLGIANIRLLGARILIYERVQALGFCMIRAVHPTAFVAPSARLGAGAWCTPTRCSERT